MALSYLSATIYTFEELKRHACRFILSKWQSFTDLNGTNRAISNLQWSIIKEHFIMDLDWKKIGSYAVGGIVAGMAAVTLVGNFVDGDESFVFQDASKNTAVVMSRRGGLFSHAHPLTQYCDMNGVLLYDASGNILFTINSEVAHSHAEITDKYTIIKTPDKCIITGGDSSNVSKTGGGHTHNLQVVAYIDKFGNLTNYDASGNKISA
jgi:hypothetical protein